MLNYYERTVLYLDDYSRLRAFNVATADGVLCKSFMLLGEKAFNENMEGNLSYLYKMSLEVDESKREKWFHDALCEGFQKAFRQTDVCDRFRNIKYTNVDKERGRKPTIIRRDGQVDGLVDMICWQSLHLDHTFWDLLKAFSKYYSLEKSGVEIKDFGDWFAFEWMDDL